MAQPAKAVMARVALSRGKRCQLCHARGPRSDLKVANKTDRCVDAGELWQGRGPKQRRRMHRQYKDRISGWPTLARPCIGSVPSITRMALMNDAPLPPYSVGNMSPMYCGQIFPTDDSTFQCS